MSELITPILECSKPAVLSPPWDFLQPAGSVRQIVDVDALQKGLRDAFPGADLGAADKLCRDRVLKVLAETEKGPAFDLVSCRTRLVGQELPVADCFRDYYTSIRANKYKLLFVTFSSADLALLSQLRLPVMPATYFERLTSADARQLLCPSPKDASAVPTPRRLADEKIALHLVATNLFELRDHYAPGFLPVVSKLEQIERALKLDTSSHIRIMLPSAACFRRIVDAVQLADQKLLVNSLLDAAKHSMTVQQFVAETADDPVADLCSTFVDVRDEAQYTSDTLFPGQKLRAKFEAFCRVHQTLFFDECLRRAASASEPVVRALWMAMAELTEMQLAASKQTATVQNVIKKAESLDLTLSERLKIHGELADRIIKVGRAIAEYERA